MKDEYFSRINNLLFSDDSFSWLGSERAREKVKAAFPDVEKEEVEEIAEYLNGYYEYCVDNAVALADKFKVPFIPHDEEGKAEAAEYIAKCRERYPKVEERHAKGILNTVLWLSNR